MILPEHEANELLRDAGIPMIPLVAADSPQGALDAARGLGRPVALKLSSVRFPHKSEIGGVHLGLVNDEDIETAFIKLNGLRCRLDATAKIVVEPMAPAGAEMFIGCQVHAQFGPIISIGLGGVFLELTEDVAWRLLPARQCDFREMIGELRSWPKLRAGFRNLPPADEDRFLDVMRRVADFALSRADLRELDLNPVIVTADGACVVDAMILLAG